MTHVFECLDGHTCGNPVRLVTSGAPVLAGKTMSAKRQDFIRNHDWIRTSLMYEPRGHSIMSGAFLYEPTQADCDAAILFIEVSGCLPMCGHGTIGTVTMALENGLIKPQQAGKLRLDAPAGPVDVTYEKGADGHVNRVSLVNVPSYLAAESVEVDCPGLGRITVDVAYGGNFYAIVEPQQGFEDLSQLTALEIQRLSPILRDKVNGAMDIRHPEDETIRGVSHIMWTGAPRHKDAHARNAVFYGDRAIDRSPCGTGTSARMAQLYHRSELKSGKSFVHESLIGSLFEGEIAEETEVAGRPAIRPAISGWAIQTGVNKIFVDERDPFAHGFQVI